jgi:DHA1 family inner membrane transport protein
MNTAFRFVYPFLPAIGRGLGVSLAQAGVLVSVRSAAGMATPLLVGTVGRGERRMRTMAVAVVLFATGTALTAATSVYAGAVAGFALLGLAKPLFDVSGHAFIADRVRYERRARFLGIFELTWAGALLIGAPAAGWLIDRYDWRAPFWAFAAIGVLALAALRLCVEADRVEAAPTAGRLRLSRSAAALLAVAFLFSFSAEVTIVAFGAWLEDVFDLSLVALGGAAVVIGVAELAGEGTTLAFTDRIGPRRAVAGGLVVSIGAFALVGPLSGSLGPALAVLAVAFFGFELTIVSSLPLATEVIPGARARYLALVTVAFSLSRAVGAAVGPLLFDWGGFAANAAVSAATDGAALGLLLAAVEEHGGRGPREQT